MALQTALLLSGFAPAAYGESTAMPEVVYIKLSADTPVGDLDASTITNYGLLKKNTIISIPKEYAATNARGEVDLNASLQKWLETSKRDGKVSFYKNDEGESDYYFPIQVVEPSEGSNLTGDKNNIVGERTFIPLQKIISKGQAKVVSEQSFRPTGPTRPAVPVPTPTATAPAAAAANGTSTTTAAAPLNSDARTTAESAAAAKDTAPKADSAPPAAHTTTPAAAAAITAGAAATAVPAPAQPNTAGTMTAPSAPADPTKVYIQLKADVRLRDFVGGQSSQQGHLLRGSIIAIPKEFAATNSRGDIDLEASLQKWLKVSKRGDGKVGFYQTENGRSDYYFPIEVVRPASNEREKSEINGDRFFIPLRELVSRDLVAPVTESALSGPLPKYTLARPRVVAPPPPKSQPKQRQHAQTNQRRTTTDDMEACYSCSNGSSRSSQRQALSQEAELGSFAAALNRAAANNTDDGSSIHVGQARIAPEPKTKNNRWKSTKQCAMIMGTDGTVGPWGEQMIAIMSEPKYRDAYLAGTSLRAFCPKYPKLSDEQKMQAQLWFWTSLGDEEADCNLNKYHPTHYRNKKTRELVRLNPREGWGIWALELDSTVREKRGSACKEIKSFGGQARCAIDMMYKHRLDEGRSMYSTSSYWGPVRRADEQIMTHMQRFRACF